MSPLQRYQADLAAGKIYPDEEQQRLVWQLQRIYETLASRLGNWQRFKHKLLAQKPVKGLYLWGSVGIGKTYLMDLFYNSLPTTRKLRMHFHPFMAEVHLALTRLQGQKNPLQMVARDFAKQAQVICFDEFFVNDIGDAMLLGNLLKELFKRGVCLIATSNVAPEELYKNGLQRAAFLPTIDLIKQHTKIEHAISLRDYRLRDLVQAGVYFWPLNENAERQLSAWFNGYLNYKSVVQHQPLQILNREIRVKKSADKVVWFEFEAICSMPRSQNDYLEIAKQYEVVLISGIPQFRASDTNAAIYLRNLVDICYDWRVKLILSAAVAINDLYLQGPLEFEFKRTYSRLQEMQSEDYLNGLHKVLEKK